MIIEGKKTCFDNEVDALLTSMRLATAFQRKKGFGLQTDRGYDYCDRLSRTEKIKLMKELLATKKNKSYVVGYDDDVDEYYVIEIGDMSFNWRQALS